MFSNIQLPGQHLLEQPGLWHFQKKDVKNALMIIVYQPEVKNVDRVENLKNLILGRFENGGLDEFYQWSKNIPSEVCFKTHTYSLSNEVLYHIIYMI